MEKILLNLVKSSKKDNVSFLIRFFLACGFSPNIKDKELGDASLLMIAVAIGNLELTEILIKYGADINFEDRILSRCMIDNFVYGFNLLLNNPRISRESIEFALFSSLLDSDRLFFTELLINTRRDVCLNARNDKGLDALGFAKKVKNKEAIKLLQEIKY